MCNNSLPPPPPCSKNHTLKEDQTYFYFIKEAMSIVSATKIFFVYVYLWSEHKVYQSLRSMFYRRKITWKEPFYVKKSKRASERPLCRVFIPVLRHLDETENKIGVTLGSCS